MTRRQRSSCWCRVFSSCGRCSGATSCCWPWLLWASWESRYSTTDSVHLHHAPTNSPGKKKKNKLGQRQSQTSFSSAFWILSTKKFCVQKNFVSKKILGPKKFRVQKNFGSKKTLGPKKFWVQKMLGPKNFGSKKNSLV